MATGTRELRGKTWSYVITIDPNELKGDQGTGVGTEVLTLTSEPSITRTYRGAFQDWLKHGIGNEICCRRNDDGKIVKDIWSGTWHEGEMHGYVAYFNPDEPGWSNTEWSHGSYVPRSTTILTHHTSQGNRTYHGETDSKGESNSIGTILVSPHGRGVCYFYNLVNPQSWTEYSGQFHEGRVIGKGVFSRDDERLEGVWTQDPTLASHHDDLDPVVFQPDSIIGDMRFVPSVSSPTRPAPFELEE